MKLEKLWILEVNTNETDTLNQQRTDRFLKEQRSHINLDRVDLMTFQRRDCQIKRKNFMEAQDCKHTERMESKYGQKFITIEVVGK